MILTIEKAVIKKLKSWESFSCKKYIGIALKIKNTDQISRPELIQNRKCFVILFSSTFLSLYISQAIERKINRTGRLIIEIKFNFPTSDIWNV
ncbi:hypothetical protein MP478_13705 [Chryseobacterium sp. WG14]|uniref:hypothetical protein n=1 Tax=unclassified Chryseobacterium TaxID=2593645 RepID=UPI001177F9F8|nr:MULTISPECIES: hypothetical protein [unclassified Chryseobacterium]MCQ9636557.1 hypothetical protein [Chryseobacterium sp. WG23]MCQ9640437.1 hypothetical protein [Chryseobacterium sp. WG14]